MLFQIGSIPLTTFEDGKSKEITNAICGKRYATLAHILCGCPWVLDVEKKSSCGENRYLWRHNCVLRILARAIQTKVEQVNKSPIRPALEPIKFVAAGSKSAPQQKSVRFGMLEEARDWKCDFDLPELHPEGSQFVFPYDVCMTPSRIGYVISRKAKMRLAGPELTVPMA